MFRANGHQIAARYYVWDLEGGPMGWKSPEYNAFHPVDPYLFELGWRALVGRGTERLLRSDGNRVCWGPCTTRRERCRFVTEATAWPLLDRRVA
jgi:hypothetical protein